jgi:hypothetical protein
MEWQLADANKLTKKRQDFKEFLHRCGLSNYEGLVRASRY